MQPITRSLVANCMPTRPQNAHKGTFGRVLVVAGSRMMCGAGFLCAQSALRVGAGLVYWALPQEMQPAFAAALPEVITCPLPSNQAGELDVCGQEILEAYLQRFSPSLVVLGPGLGQSPLVERLLRTLRLPMIVDADALHVLARMPDISLQAPVIFTPHPGEMAHLLGTTIANTPQTRQAQAFQWTQRHAGVCVLKGKDTLVALARAGEVEVWQNTTGGVALAKAGSGDVLAGVIAGLWAQLGTAQGFTQDTALQAALSGVYIHGLAGDVAAKKLGPFSVLARDTVNFLAAAIQQVLQEGK